MAKEKFIFVDYLRAFSVFYIVGYWHLFNYTDAFPKYYNPVTSALTEIVLGLFVFISGFLICISTKKSAGIIDLYKKRLVRIYPLYFLAVVVFFLYGLNDGATTFKSLFFVSMIYTPAPMTLWFITMIMLFYLVAPIIARLSVSLEKYLVAITLIMASLLTFQLFIGSADIRIMIYFPCFCVGIYCATNGVQNRIFSIKYAISFLFFGILAYGMQYMMKVDSWSIISLSKIPLILSFSYLIFAVSYQKRDIFVSSEFIEFLSYGSYAMYLFHRPIYITLKSLYFPENGTHQILYLVGFCLVLVTIISWSIQKLYDKLYVATNKLLERNKRIGSLE